MDDETGFSRVTAVAVEQTKARVIRRVELQDIDVIELPRVVTDPVPCAHHHLMRQAIGEPQPGPKVLARDVPYRAVVSEGHQHHRVDVPVHRLGGVERVRRGGVEGVVQPRVQGKIVRHLPVVL